MLAVLDTNVIVSALISPNGKPASVVKRFLDKELTLCCDDRIFHEYEVVLHRPKFRFPSVEIDQFLSYIRQRALFVSPTVLDIDFVDEADKKFYEVAKYCNAVLITGNLKHFPDDPLIKSVKEF